MVEWPWLTALVFTALPIRQASVDEVTRALQSEAGRPRVVHVWASWCGPCVVELPDVLMTLREAQKRGVDVVLLSLDPPEAEKAAARLLQKASGATRSSGGMSSTTRLWASLRADSPRAIAALRTLDGEWDGSIPTTYLLGHDGKLVVAQRGGTDLAQLAAEIDRI